MSQKLSDLDAKVDTLLAANDQACALLDELKTDLENAGTDPVAIGKISDKLTAGIAKVQATIARDAAPAAVTPPSPEQSTPAGSGEPSQDSGAQS